MSQRTTPTSADRAPALRRLSATPGELPSSHCQFVRFSLGASAGCSARSIPMSLRHIRGNEGASRALNGTNMRQPLYPHHRPSRRGRKSLSPVGIVQHWRTSRWRRLSYINISNNVRWAAHAQPSRPVSEVMQRGLMHCFVSFPADLSRDGASSRERVRRLPCVSCPRISTNIT
jgi:hypothetical protein